MYKKYLHLNIFYIEWIAMYEVAWTTSYVKLYSITLIVMKYKFHTKRLEEIYLGLRTDNLHQEIIELYRLRIRFIRNATCIADLKSRKSFNLEKLKSWRYKDKRSIRLNRQRRLIFDMTNELSLQVVDIIDVSKHYE